MTVEKEVVKRVLTKNSHSCVIKYLPAPYNELCAPDYRNEANILLQCLDKIVRPYDMEFVIRYERDYYLGNGDFSDPEKLDNPELELAPIRGGKFANKSGYTTGQYALLDSTIKEIIAYLEREDEDAQPST